MQVKALSWLFKSLYPDEIVSIEDSANGMIVVGIEFADEYKDNEVFTFRQNALDDLDTVILKHLKGRQKSEYEFIDRIKQVRELLKEDPELVEILKEPNSDLILKLALGDQLTCMKGPAGITGPTGPMGIQGMSCTCLNSKN